MGWFTNRTKVWELQNMWGLFLSILLLPISMLGIQAIIIVLMSIISKKVSWLLFGLSTFTANWIIFSILVSSSKPEKLFILGWFWAILVGLNCIYVAFITKEYLQREDLKNYFPLELGKTYLYKKKDAITTTGVSRKDTFLEKLYFFRKEIEDQSIKNNIDKMIHLVNFIDQKDKVKSDIFLARHADTLERVFKQYDDIENSGLENEITAASKTKLVGVISVAAKAFEQELTNQFKTEILEVDAETEAYIQNLENRNLLDNNKI